MRPSKALLERSMCVTPFVDILREGLRGADILRVGVTVVMVAR